jgi:hypothetical protein
MDYRKILFCKDLTLEQKAFLSMFAIYIENKEVELSSRDLSCITGTKLSKTLSILKELISLGIVSRIVEKDPSNKQFQKIFYIITTQPDADVPENNIPPTKEITTQKTNSGAHILESRTRESRTRESRIRESRTRESRIRESRTRESRATENQMHILYSFFSLNNIYSYKNLFRLNTEEIVFNQKRLSFAEQSLSGDKLKKEENHKEAEKVSSLMSEKIDSYVKRISSKNKEAVEILMFWNSLPNLVSHRTSSKRAVLAIEKTNQALKKYPKEKIFDCIREYSEILGRERTYISKKIPGHFVGLDEFFRIGTFTKQRVAKIKKEGLKVDSWFRVILDGKTDVLLKRSVPEDEILYRKLKEAYLQKVVGVVPDSSSFITDSVDDRIVVGSNKLIKFYKSIEGKLLLEETVYDLAEDLVDSLKKTFKEITAGHLCSDYTFSFILPKFLSENAIIRSGEEIVL